MKIKRTNKLLLVTFSLLSLILLFVGVVIALSKYFDNHVWTFTAPIMVKLNRPLTISDRKPLIIHDPEVISYTGEIDTPIKKYICDKFGLMDCRMALAIAQAENGTFQPDRFHINDNGTIDVGIFQVNSIHFKQAGCSLAEIVDQYKNVDCAYSIWKASGWHAWSTFNSGAFANTYGK